MKPLLIFFLYLLFTGNNANAQCNNGLKIQSPVAQKPTEPGIASVSCNTLVVKWKGHPGELYEITVTVKDASTDKEMRSFTTKNFEAKGSNYTSTITVPSNTKISWSVQAIKLTNNRVFYSYPLRGDKDYVVPACDKKPAIALTNKRNDSLMVIADKKMEVKVYPNPVQSILNIDFQEPGRPQKRISVYDVNGRLLLTRSANGNTQLDVRSLANGIYLVKINDETGREVYDGKVIKRQ
ncbi:MAG TPA: T9SS type A sorting domain-containing protein [Parafilimonas sp.]|nr:T9SS type A sorting domain-containing protein [Parafilimonas sp.]